MWLIGFHGGEAERESGKEDRGRRGWEGDVERDCESTRMMEWIRVVRARDGLVRHKSTSDKAGHAK